VPTETTAQRTPLLEIRSIHKSFSSGGLFRKGHDIVAAEDVSFSIDRGEIVALVGESGSGKSTIARLLLRLDQPDAGEIRLDGEDVLASQPKHASLAYRGRVQMVMQDPFGSLNRVHNIAYHIIRPLIRHKRCAKKDARAFAIDLLTRVGLEPAEDYIDRYPYQLSGGQRQRVAIARALAAKPDLLVADEPTSMLDVSIRMGVLNLLAAAKKERGLAIILITHDLASARYLADRVHVLFRGRVVEGGPSDVIVRSPKHPYTQELVGAIADSGALGRAASGYKTTLAGEDAGPGCPFTNRCPEVKPVCYESDPATREVDGRQVRCHLYPIH
jgi:oligopeptide/dipeptide ABC transporter ATP-binding protein